MRATDGDKTAVRKTLGGPYDAERAESGTAPASSDRALPNQMPKDKVDASTEPATASRKARSANKLYKTFLKNVIKATYRAKRVFQQPANLAKLRQTYRLY
jgi:hypothetical protein